MNETLGIYRTIPGGSTDLKQIKDRAHNYYLARAQDLLRKNDLAAAEAEARSALQCVSHPPHRNTGRPWISLCGSGSL